MILFYKYATLRNPDANLQKSLQEYEHTPLFHVWRPVNSTKKNIIGAIKIDNFLKNKVLIWGFYTLLFNHSWLIYLQSTSWGFFFQNAI